MFGYGRPLNFKNMFWCIILLFIMFSKISHLWRKIELTFGENKLSSLH